MPAAAVPLIVTFLLVLLNAVFVAIEYAIVRIRPTQLEQLAMKGDSRAAGSLHITQNLESYISAAQIGITVASLAIGWIGEPAFASLLEPHVVRLSGGALAAGATHALAIGLSLISITLLHLVLGELVPKTFALKKTVPTVLWLAAPLRVFYYLVWPLNWLVDRMGAMTLYVMGLGGAHAEAAHTADELRLILSRSPGMFDGQIRQMLVRVIDFRRRTAKHVMQLASDVVCLRANDTFETATKIALENRYTRYPVLDAEGKTALGFVHMQDLFAVNAGVRKARRLIEIMREPIYTSFDTPIEKLRQEMQARQLHLAIITQAGNRFAGIATLEDLLEEIVGEIRDESDVEVPPIARRAEDVVEVSGNVLLEDIERETGFALRSPHAETETVHALITRSLGNNVKVGDRLEVDNYLLIVTDVTARRVIRSRILRIESESTEGNPS